MGPWFLRALFDFCLLIVLMCPVLPLLPAAWLFDRRFFLALTSSLTVCPRATGAAVPIVLVPKHDVTAGGIPAHGAGQVVEALALPRVPRETAAFPK
jgi:hypothetical protein